MTVNEAAIKLGVSKYTVYKYIEHGKNIGPYFKKNEFGVYTIDARRVRSKKVK